MTLETEMQAVVDWFITHNVPSISPATSVHLLWIAEKVRDAIAKDEYTPQAIRAYGTALDMVARAGHIQQGVIIARLGRAIGKTDVE